MANAIGRTVDIPILVRSLGHDMHRFGYHPDMTFRPGLDLMTYLDGTQGSANGHGHKYYVPWWEAAAPFTKSTNAGGRIVNHATFLNGYTIKRALKMYRDNLAKIKVNLRPKFPTCDLKVPVYNWHPGTESPDPIDCIRC